VVRLVLGTKQPECIFFGTGNKQQQKRKEEEEEEEEEGTEEPKSKSGACPGVAEAGLKERSYHDFIKYFAKGTPNHDDRHFHVQQKRFLSSGVCPPPVVLAVAVSAVSGVGGVAVAISAVIAAIAAIAAIVVIAAIVAGAAIAVSAVARALVVGLVGKREIVGVAEGVGKPITGGTRHQGVEQWNDQRIEVRLGDQTIQHRVRQHPSTGERGGHKVRFLFVKSSVFVGKTPGRMQLQRRLGHSGTQITDAAGVSQVARVQGEDGIGRLVSGGGWWWVVVVQKAKVKTNQIQTFQVSRRWWWWWWWWFVLPCKSNP